MSSPCLSTRNPYALSPVECIARGFFEGFLGRVHYQISVAVLLCDFQRVKGNGFIFRYRSLDHWLEVFRTFRGRW